MMAITTSNSMRVNADRREEIMSIAPNRIGLGFACEFSERAAVLAPYSGNPQIGAKPVSAGQKITSLRGTASHSAVNTSNGHWAACFDRPAIRPVHEAKTRSTAATTWFKGKGGL